MSQPNLIQPKICMWAYNGLFCNSVGVELLRSKYDAILQSLPSDYERTLQAIQDHLTDEQICNVLGSSNSSLANEIILDCITEKMKYDGDMLDVCDQLEKISSTLSDSSVLNSVIRELRKGKCIQYGGVHTA